VPRALLRLRGSGDDSPGPPG